MEKLFATILSVIARYCVLAYFSQNGITSAASDAVIVLFLALLTIAAFVALVVFLCKYAENSVSVTIKHRAVALAAILGAGFAVRLIFGLCIRGYREDYKLFTDMFAHLASNGLDGYYNGNYSETLYPTVYFVYLIFGGLSNVTGLSDFALGAQFMVKFPMIIANLLTAFAVYLIANRYFNTRIALTLAAFVCVCPIFFIGSALWTSQIVFAIMFACFACYFTAKKSYAPAILFYTLAAFSSKEGIYLFPVAATYSVFHLVRAIINIKRNKPQGREILSSDCRAVISVPIGFVGSIAIAYLIGLFMTASYSCNPFVYIYEFTLAPLVKWSHFTYNGLSVYAIFNQNGEVPGARFPSGVFAGIFAAIIVAVVCVVYFSKRNRATMVMLAAYSLFTMQIYYPGSNGVGMLFSLAVLVAAYALVKDKRLLYVLFVAGLAFVINSSSVLANAGYLNNIADYNFASDSYVGSTLMSGAVGAVGITCSVFAVLAHLYFTVIAVSVGMTGQKKMLSEAVGIGGALGEFFSPKRGGK